MQRSLAAFLAFAAALVLPLAAHADPIDNFVLTGGGQTLSFSLPATSSFPDHMNFGFFIEDGATFYLSTCFCNSPTISFGPDLNVIGPQTFSLTSVPASNPFPYYQDDLVVAFIPGTYDFQGYDQDPPVSYTLTITPETATTPTPEPSSALLLGTGIFGLIGLTTLKRHRKAFL
jgi:hypothetical protein